jgi:hypothetical protein
MMNDESDPIPVFNSSFIVHHLSFPMESFQQFQASALYCPRCRKAMPVREKLLLVLPDGELFEYLCAKCASSLGKRRVKAGDQNAPIIIKGS